PYTPAITSASAPCFVSAEATLTVDFLDGVPFTLRHAQVAATYVGSPATGLANGLIRGFLTEADADATIIPASFPVVGGMPVSALLPGGTNCCAAHSDKDMVEGVPGWWMYFNFTATEVPYAGPQVSVPEPGGSTLALISKNPSGLPLRLEYRLDSDGPASISVHDLSGRRVAELASGELPSGSRTLTWDGRLEGGGSVRPGFYVIRLATARGTIARRVVLLR
ncbi:MAG: FlgD immunoglobulin-like domain containing protein, partial [bacterium]